MVGVTGFEPTTPASRTQCSTGLSYTPTFLTSESNYKSLSTVKENNFTKDSL